MNAGDGTVMKKEAEKAELYTDITVPVQRRSKVRKGIPGITAGHWDHLRITQTIPEQQTGKARN